jgi:cellulose synthase/poly-beta-1,6-N-acetylglucosamine synthase-like glycosyltransferase
MTTVFLLVAGAGFLLALHPFGTYPLSLWLLRKFRARGNASSERESSSLSFAVCMCAYNEEAVIEQKVRNLLELREREPGLRIHVYVDAGSDRTADILRRYGPSLDLHVSAERHGKTHGMNLLSERAQADVLIFTDANVMLDLNCVADLRRHFADPEVGCVCGNLNYVNGNDSVTAATGSLYWRLEEALKRLESDTGSMMGADGSLFAVRRELRRAPPSHIIDDMYVSLMVLVNGSRVIQARDVRAYERSVTSSPEEFARKVRISCQAFNVHGLVWPHLRKLDALTRYKYISHKFLRWLSIYFLTGATLSFLAALVVAGYGLLALALVAAGIAFLSLGFFASMKPFAQVTDVLLALTGTGLGVWRSLRGERFQIWTPANSIREGQT